MLTNGSPYFAGRQGDYERGLHATRRSFGERQSSSVRAYIFRALLVKRASAASTPPLDFSEIAVQSTNTEMMSGLVPL
jgi:hypothetical protein